MNLMPIRQDRLELRPHACGSDAGILDDPGFCFKRVCIRLVIAPRG